jgi:hypothetical protein
VVWELLGGWACVGWEWMQQAVGGGVARVGGLTSRVDLGSCFKELALSSVVVCAPWA